MAERRNHEGYPDPTAYAALTNIEQCETRERRRHAKEFLSEAARLDCRIGIKLEQLEELRALAERVTGSMSVHTGAVTSGHGRTEDAIVKITWLEQEIEEDIDRLLDRKRRIRELVAAVPDPAHQTLLELRYLCFRPWERIAEELHYSLHHLYKLHNAALDVCERILEGQGEDT